MDEYTSFLARKAAVAPPCGVDPAWLADQDIGRDADGKDYLFPFQKALVRWGVRRGKALLGAAVGLGKALAADAPVLTSDGWRPIASLSVGDMVYGSDGKLHNVIGVYPQGDRELYRVTFTDGGVTVCDAEHLWSVRNNEQRHRTITLRQIMSEGIMKGLAHRHFIPMVDPIETQEEDLPIDPYTLGVILGDGGLTHGTPALTTDDEIARSIIVPECVEVRKMVDVSPGVSTYTIAGKGPKGQANMFTSLLKVLGLHGLYSHEKFIPAIYMSASVEQRRALLSGLLDTDGYVEKTMGITVEYTTSSPRLAADVRALVLSLGGVAHTGIKAEPKYKHNGEDRIGKPNYRLNVRFGGTRCPFRLSRKASLWKPRTKYPPTRAIHKIESAGRGQAVCISVDSPDRLFVTGDYVLTHNTRTEGEWARVAMAYLSHQAKNKSHAGSCEAAIFTPLAVAQQTVRELNGLGIPAHYIKGPEQMLPGVITVTNYDRVKAFSSDRFGAVVLDEASVIKHDDSATAQFMIDYCRRIPFVLDGTATPAPNAFLELLMYAEQLGIMTRQEAQSMFFVKDSGSGAGSSAWRLKGHARRDFWRWVASFAAVVQYPSDLGFSDDGYILPPVQVVKHVIRASKEHDMAVLDITKKPGVAQQLNLMAMPARGLRAQAKARLVTMKERVEAAAEIVSSHSPRQWSIWCSLNKESDELQHAIAPMIPGCVEVVGSDSAEKKERAVLGFADGSIPAIVTKSSICGYGINWQRCADLILVGPGHSWEDLHQIRGRHWRFGQTKTVSMHVVYTDLEGDVIANLDRKEHEAKEMADAMREHVGSFVLESVMGSSRSTTPYTPNVPMKQAEWLRSEA